MDGPLVAKRNLLCSEKLMPKPIKEELPETITTYFETSNDSITGPVPLLKREIDSEIKDDLDTIRNNGLNRETTLRDNTSTNKSCRNCGSCMSNTDVKPINNTSVKQVQNNERKQLTIVSEQCIVIDDDSGDEQIVSNSVQPKKERNSASNGPHVILNEQSIVVSSDDEDDQALIVNINDVAQIQTNDNVNSHLVNNSDKTMEETQNVRDKHEISSAPVPRDRITLRSIKELCNQGNLIVERNFTKISLVTKSIIKF